ncbi:MAG: haloacid dehalogenase-like hydrolase [Phycisphaerae bacterium]|nr:haloacid dehalogenase-like hydrolase [Phycisphaerae bacterium]
MIRSRTAVVFCLLAVIAGCQASDPLPSWNEGAAKQRIVAFVRTVTDPASETYVRPAERIAVFDNDGTLWTEQPLYVQVEFIFDRIQALAPNRPEWAEKPVFKAALNRDYDAMRSHGHAGLIELVLAAQTGMTTDEFEQLVLDWLATAKHPRFDQPYTACVYQPMLELLDYLRANGFQTWIVSAGNAGFIRPWTEQAYGIPPEQVVASRVVAKYELRDGIPVIMRMPESDFSNSGPDKAVGIYQLIGRRPILAVGNSDGDFEMLEWTTAGPGRRLGVFIHHDDTVREAAYDRDSSIGRLRRGLDAAAHHDWLVVSMKNDWRRIFPFELASR